MGITNTINRAELAAITAAILHGHSHIATDSLSSLHQIREHLLYHELQGALCNSTSLQAFVQSPEPESATTQSAAHPFCGGQVL